MSKQRDHLTAGPRHTRPTAPAHVRGVPQGGSTGSIRREVGIYPQGKMAIGTARRSTGINAKDRNPIDPRSPNLSPA